MEAKVDQNLCIGCGACVALCPNSFHLAEDTGKALPVAAAGDINCAQDAAQSCPVQAISVA